MIRVYRAKSVQVTFITDRETCPSIILNGLKISQTEDAKYLGLYLDRRLNWRKHKFTKTTRNSIEQNVLAARQQIVTID